MDFQINNSNEEFKTRFPTAIAALPSHNVIFIGFDNGDIQTYVTQDLNSSGGVGKILYVVRDCDVISRIFPSPQLSFLTSNRDIKKFGNLWKLY